MTREKILEIANELNELILKNERDFWVLLANARNEIVHCEFSHFSSEYKYRNNKISFYEFDSEEVLRQKFELAKKVIAGECLIDE